MKLRKWQSFIRLTFLFLLVVSICFPASPAYAADTEKKVASSSRITTWSPSHNYTTAGLDAIIKHFSLQNGRYWSYHQSGEDFKTDQEFSSIRSIFISKYSGKKLYDTGNTSVLKNQAGLSGTNLTKAKSWVNAMGSSTNKTLVGSNQNFTGSTGKANTWSTANKHRVGDNHYYGYSWYSSNGGLQRECDGFASFIAYCLSGSDTYKSWKIVTSSIKSNSDLRVGDIIRAGGHTAIVYKVTSSSITFFQACGSSYNKIVIGKFQGSGTPNTWSSIKSLSGCTVWRAKDNTGTTTSSPSQPTSKPKFTIGTETYPGNNTTLSAGKSFGLRGTYKVDSGTISNVSAVIKNSKGKAVYSYSATPNSTSFDVTATKGTNGKTLNNTMSFSKLDTGKYTFELTLKATNAKGTTTYSLSRDFSVSYSKPKFTISTNFNGPSSLKKGSGFGLRGKISVDCGELTITAKVVDSKGKTVDGFFYGACWNNSFDVQKTINNKFMFGKLAKGSYTYSVVIEANNHGVTNTYTYTKNFTVK